MRKILASMGRCWQRLTTFKLSSNIPLAPPHVSKVLWKSQLSPQKAPPQAPWRPRGSSVGTARLTPGQTSLSRGSCTSSPTSTSLSPLSPPLPSSSSPLSSSASSEAATTTSLKVSLPQEPLHPHSAGAQIVQRPNPVSPASQSGLTWKWSFRSQPRLLLFVLGSLLSVSQCPAGNSPHWWTQVWGWKGIWKWFCPHLKDHKPTDTFDKTSRWKCVQLQFSNRLRFFNNCKCFLNLHSFFSSPWNKLTLFVCRRIRTVLRRDDDEQGAHGEHEEGWAALWGDGIFRASTQQVLARAIWDLKELLRSNGRHPFLVLTPCSGNCPLCLVPIRTTTPLTGSRKVNFLTLFQPRMACQIILPFTLLFQSVASYFYPQIELYICTQSGQTSILIIFECFL